MPIGDKETIFEKGASFNVDLGMTVGSVHIEPHPLKTRVINDYGVVTAMPHHYWPIGVNAVEELPINISMPTRVMAVNKNRFIVGTVSRQGSQNLEEIGAGADSANLCPGKVPLYCSREIHREKPSRHRGMKMRVDKPWH